MTKAEWVARWVCAYGDSGEFARYLWEQTSQGADSIGADGNAGPPFGQFPCITCLDWPKARLPSLVDAG